MKTIFEEAGADAEILKRGGALCWSPWLAEEKKLGFRWSEKAKIAVGTISFWQNICISIFRFSPF